VAVLRARAAELPLAFRLDDSMAMSPAAKLSGASRVAIVARISRSGQASAQPGDLQGTSNAVAPGATGVRVLIDRVVD
jgi:cytochrome c-type biogenesis protein CcmH